MDELQCKKKSAMKVYWKEIFFHLSDFSFKNLPSKYEFSQFLAQIFEFRTKISLFSRCGIFLPCVVIKMSCSLMLSADSIKGKKRQERNPLVHIQCMVSLNTKKSAILGKSHHSFFISYSIT